MGFDLWAGKVTQLNFGSQVWYVVIAGAGMGFMLTPASTDAVNRASSLSYGEATGITQTVRNYAASLGLAILGTILVSSLKSRLLTSLLAQGIPSGRATKEAASISQAANGSGGGSGSGTVASIPHFVRLDFAYATRNVLHVMALIMIVAAVVALVGLQPGVQQDIGGADQDSAVESSTG